MESVHCVEIGGHVMLRRNLNWDKEFVNGAVGIVEDLQRDPGTNVELQRADAKENYAW